MSTALLHQESVEERSLAATGTARSRYSPSCQWLVVSRIAPNASPGTVSPFFKAQGQANTQIPQVFREEIHFSVP